MQKNKIFYLHLKMQKQKEKNEVKAKAKAKANNLSEDDIEVKDAQNSTLGTKITSNEAHYFYHL